MRDQPNDLQKADPLVTNLLSSAVQAERTIDTDLGNPDQTTDLTHAVGLDTARRDDTSVQPLRPDDETATFVGRQESFEPDRTGGYTPSEDDGGSSAGKPPTFPGYTLLGVLGRGGMGVVYKARQLGLGRIVALKMILAGPHASAAAIARFRAEAQAVARFQHPNLVQVFEVGEADGLPFFTLEYVAGGTLSKKVAGEPQTPKAAAETVEQLARAMHYAHERGIAHRDLKPANILLTADGTPKITDFGLAKSLEGESGQTYSGQIMGTPSYMAPEQAAGRVDIGAPADVYALGAILYDLLTGRPPFAGSSVLDTLEMVRTREPVPPSQLTGKLPRDLETICLKCLQKDIAKRYASAAELADDLRRYLDGRPILARPVGRAEKAWRWAKRNPAGAAAVLFGLAALVVPSVLSVLLFIAEGKATEAKEYAEGKRVAAEIALEAEEAAKKKTEIALADKEVERKRADENFRSASDRFNKALIVIREALRPIDNKMRGRLTLAPLRMEIVNLMLRQLDDLRKSSPDVKDPLDARTEAVAHARMGGIYLETGRVAAAAEELVKALPILTATAEQNPTNVTALANHSNILNQLADTDRRLGNSQKARERYAAGLAIREKRLPLFDALRKDGKVEDISVTNAQFQVADSYGLVALTDLRLGDPEAAIVNYLASDKGFAALAIAGTLEVLVRRSEIRVRLGDAHLHLRKFDAAENHYRAAVKERVRLLEITPEKTGLQPTLRTLIGQSRMSLGDFLLMARANAPAATAEYRAAYRLFADALKADPDSIDLQRLAAATHYRLGYVAGRRTGLDWLVSPSDPVDHFAACLRLREPLAKIDPSDTQAKVEWMLALGRAGKTVEAEKLAGELEAIKQLDQQVRFQVVCGYAVVAGKATDRAVADRARDRAFAALAELTKAWKARGQLELDPDLDALRSDPRFQKLVGK